MQTLRTQTIQHGTYNSDLKATPTHRHPERGVLCYYANNDSYEEKKIKLPGRTLGASLSLPS